MMPPKKRKHRRALPRDIFSNLPENVIDVILLHLPSRDAVRTSVLSKKWRYHWCRLTVLTLDSSLWETLEYLVDPTPEFSKVMYQLLSLHEGPITKFTLDVTHLKRCPDINYLVNFLSRNGIQHLILHLSQYNLDKVVPCSLFTCSQLRHLTLKNCEIHPPLSFKGFGRLISLKLCTFITSSDLLGGLISQCPLLEQLALRSPDVENAIEINAPLLRSLYFTGSMSSIYLKNVPLLSKVSVVTDEVYEADFAKFFEFRSSLEYLLFDFYDDELVEQPDEAPARLPYDLNRVKHLYLPDMIRFDSHKLSWYLCLLRSCPHLEYLEIKVNKYEIGALESFELEHFSDVTFKLLREVTLVGFSGRAHEMQLIKLLLAKSAVLVTMLIKYGQASDGGLKMRDEVSKYQRASPKAEIVYEPYLRSGSSMAKVFWKLNFNG